MAVVGNDEVLPAIIVALVLLLLDKDATYIINPWAKFIQRKKFAHIFNY